MARVPQSGSKGAAAVREPENGGGIGQTIPYHALCDYAGREAMIAAFGEQIVGTREVDFITSFNYFIDPEKVSTSDSTGSFGATVDASRLKLTAGAAGVGVAIADSKPNVLYRSGFDAYVMYTCAFDPFSSGNTQQHGPHDSLNGYSISLESGNALAINHYSAGVLLSTTLQSNFELDHLDGAGHSGFTINPQAMNIYRIAWGYLGVLPASFEIYGGVNIGWIPFHYIDITGIGNSLIVEDPNLPLRFHATSDGVVSVAMYSGSWNGGTIGPVRNRWLNDQFSTAIAIAGFTGATAGKPVMTIRNDTTFKTKVNKIPADIDGFTVSVDGNKTHLIELIKNGTLGGATSFAQVDPDSAMSVDKGSTTITGGKLMRSYSMGKVADLGVGALFGEGEIRLYPGETLTYVIVSTSTSSDVAGSMHWDELK